MKYIDIHGHINFAAYDNDREEVIKRALDKEVAMITVGTQFETSNFAVELARKYENVYACIGLHPIHTSKSFHDTQEFGHEGKDFTSKGEVVDFERYIAFRRFASREISEVKVLKQLPIFSCSATVGNLTFTVKNSSAFKFNRPSLRTPELISLLSCRLSIPAAK
jgi:hypothetical protein